MIAIERALDRVSLRMLSRRPPTVRASIVWYAVPRVLGRGLVFLLLPVYTRVLSPSEFGTAAVALAVAGVIRLVVAPGMEGLYLRYAYGRDALDRSAADRVGTVLRVHLLLTALALAVLALGAQPVTTLVMPGVPLGFYYLVLVTVGLASLAAPVQAGWRAQHRADKVALLQFVHAMVGAATILTALLVFRVGPVALVLGDVVAGAVILPVCLRPIVVGWRARWNATVFRLALPAVAALWPEAFTTWALSGLERIFLNRIAGPAELGWYSAAYQIGAALMMIALIVNKEWQPLVYDLTSGPRPRVDAVQRLWMDSLHLFVAFGSLLSVLAVPIATLVLGPGYQAATSLIPIVVLIGVVRVPALFMAHACWAFGKMRALTVSNVVAVTAFVAANLVLIPSFGAVGAAWAGVIGYAAGVGYLSRRPWNVFRFRPRSIAWAALFAVATLAGRTASPVLITITAGVVTMLLARQAWSFWRFLGGLRPHGPEAQGGLC